MNRMEILRKEIGTKKETRQCLSCVTLTISLAAFFIFIMAAPQSIHAAVFNCSTVTCLINSINQANSTKQPDTIILAAGTYTLTEVNNVTDEENGLPSITSAITIRGASPDTVIIERPFGHDRPFFRIFHIASTGKLKLERITIRGGNRPTNGGGIFNNGGNVIVTNSIIDSNFAEFGGGIFNLSGTVKITTSILTANMGDEGSGAIDNRGIVNVANSVVSGNFGLSGTISNRHRLTVSNSIITSNHGGDGTGGIQNIHPGIARITNCTISDNVSDFSPGGVSNSGKMFIAKSTIINNRTEDSGGGVGNSGFRNSGTMTITHSTIANNSAGVADFVGGGIVNDFGGTLTIMNTEITHNSADFGGGIANTNGTVRLQNSILALNTARSDGPDCFGSIISRGNNVIGDTSDCEIVLQRHPKQ